jgi:hypothetical protein
VALNGWIANWDSGCNYLRINWSWILLIKTRTSKNLALAETPASSPPFTHLLNREAFSYTGQHKNTRKPYVHPRPEWISNQRSQCSIFRRQHTSQDRSASSVNVCQPQRVISRHIIFLIMRTDMGPWKFRLLFETRLTEKVAVQA